MEKYCSSCQSDNELDAKYCSVCGAPLPVQEVRKSDPLPFQRKPKKKQNVVLIAIAVVCFWAAFLGIRYAITPTLEEKLDKEAAELNRGCPIQLDPYTTLVSVKHQVNKTIQYNYQLRDLYKADMDLNLIRERVYPSLLKNAKENPQLQSFRDSDITIKYNYVDQNKEFVTEFVITPKMYK